MAYKRVVVNGKGRRKKTKKKATKRATSTRRNAKKRTTKKKATKRKSKKRPSAKQLAARRAFAAKYGGKKAKKKTSKKRGKKKAKRNASKGSVLSRTAKTKRKSSTSSIARAKAHSAAKGRAMAASFGVQQRVTKELGDLRKLVSEITTQCKKTERSLKTKLGLAKRHLASAEEKLVKANAKIRSLQGKIKHMKDSDIRALEAASKKTQALGKEAVRLSKLVQYYTYDGAKEKRKGGKSWVGNKKSRKRTCPSGKARGVAKTAKGASAAASRLRAGEPRPGDAKSLAYRRWCAGVKREFFKGTGKRR